MAAALFQLENAAAFGPNGHRIVGRIAERHLSAEAKSAVKALIGPQSIAQVSTWADEIKADLRYRAAGPWHYVTIEDGETYASSKKNPNGDAVAKLLEVIDVLKQGVAPRQQQQEALKWLVHLTGDVHQPLHVGRGDDRGGNSISVDWFGDSRNLHSVWDTGIVEAVKLSFSEYAEFIDQSVTVKVEAPGQPDVMLWIRESQNLRDEVYEEPAPGIGGSYRYVYQKRPILEARLKQAGLRLAQTLNYLFSDRRSRK